MRIEKRIRKRMTWSMSDAKRERGVSSSGFKIIG